MPLTEESDFAYRIKRTTSYKPGTSEEGLSKKLLNGLFFACSAKLWLRSSTSTAFEPTKGFEEEAALPIMPEITKKIAIVKTIKATNTARKTFRKLLMYLSFFKLSTNKPCNLIPGFWIRVACSLHSQRTKIKIFAGRN